MVSLANYHFPWLATLALVVLVALPVQLTHAQAVQAVKSMQPAGPVYSSSQIDELARAVNTQVNALMSIREEIELSTDRPVKDLLPALNSLMEDGLNLLSGSRESSDFVLAYERFREKHQTFKVRLDRTIARDFRTYDHFADLSATANLRDLPTPTPQGSRALSDVTFTLGTSQHVADARSAVNTVDIHTSLLGDVVGAVFEFFGSPALQQYFSKNLSFGASIPTRGDNKVASGFGLGLGELRQQGIRMWPVVGLMQRDAADNRFLGDLNQQFPAEETWSAPIVSVAFALDRTADAIRRHEVGPIFTFGLQFQQYYPGNAFSAVGALFTKDISKYEKSGNLGFSFGVSIPVMQGNRN